MSVKRIRPVGRPTFIEVALLDWAFAVAKDIELTQQDLNFVASGESLNQYEAQIIKRNRVVINWADYLKYSVSGRGRKPGGGRAPISVIADWLVEKGISPPEDFWPKTNKTKTGLSREQRAINNFAAAISVAQQQRGNQVHKGQRAGIPIDLIIDNSFDAIADQMAFDIARGAADELIKNINKFKKWLTY